MAFALTFDDGPGPSTPALLDVLGEHDCKATFFMLGDNLRDANLSPVVVRLLKSGHLAGNHTVTHKAGTLQELRAEIDQCDRELVKFYEDAGVAVPHPIPFRLPFGIRTFIAERIEGGIRRPAAALDNRLQVLASMGRTHVHWTKILPDYTPPIENFAEYLANMAMEHIEEMAKEGLDAVLTMHDSSPRDERGLVFRREDTVKAVDIILTMAKSKGVSSFRVPLV